MSRLLSSTPLGSPIHSNSAPSNAQHIRDASLTIPHEQVNEAKSALGQVNQTFDSLIKLVENQQKHIETLESKLATSETLKKRYKEKAETNKIAYNTLSADMDELAEEMAREKKKNEQLEKTIVELKKKLPNNRRRLSTADFE